MDWRAGRARTHLCTRANLLQASSVQRIRTVSPIVCLCIQLIIPAPTLFNYRCSEEQRSAADASSGTTTACCLMAAAGRMTSWWSRAPCPAARFPSASVCLQRVSGHGCLTDHRTALRLFWLLPLHGRHSRSLALSPAHFLVWRVQLEHFRPPAASTRCCCPLRWRFQRGIYSARRRHRRRAQGGERPLGRRQMHGAAPRQTRMAITTRAGSLADLRTAWARSLQPAAAFCTRANFWQTR